MHEAPTFFNSTNGKMIVLGIAVIIVLVAIKKGSARVYFLRRFSDKIWHRIVRMGNTHIGIIAIYEMALQLLGSRGVESCLELILNEF